MGFHIHLEKDGSDIGFVQYSVFGTRDEDGANEICIDLLYNQQHEENGKNKKTGKLWKGVGTQLLCYAIAMGQAIFINDGGLDQVYLETAGGEFDKFVHESGPVLFYYNFGFDFTDDRDGLAAAKRKGLNVTGETYDFSRMKNGHYEMVLKRDYIDRLQPLFSLAEDGQVTAFSGRHAPSSVCLRSK